ncbi:MAG TPA: hypothetical protein VGB55_03575 [Tepidisphaeraceae bacterium]
MSHSKGKASAAANARNRAQATNHLSEAPSARSNHGVDQNRDVQESPLQGADRPATGRGGKLQGTPPTADQEFMGRTPISEGERKLREAQGTPNGNNH